LMKIITFVILLEIFVDAGSVLWTFDWVLVSALKVLRTRLLKSEKNLYYLCFYSTKCNALISRIDWWTTY
jgi:hypothetical protein